MEYLLNSFCATGDELGKFRETVENLEKNTSFEVVSKKDIILFSALADEDMRRRADGSFQCNVVDKRSLSDLNINGAPLPTGFVSSSKLDSKLLAELYNTTRVIIGVGKSHYYVGESAMATLCKNAGLKTSRPTLVRDLAIEEGLLKESGKMTLVTRSEMSTDTGMKCKKIFACMSGRYNPIPLRIVPDAADRLIDEAVLGKGVVTSWIVDHNIARIHIEFPDAAEDYAELYKTENLFIPGIEITSSDTGFSSVFVRSTLRREDSRYYVIADEFARKHSGKITAEEILDLANKTVLTDLRLLPEKLSKLMGQVITPEPLSGPRSKARNRNAVADVIKNVAKELDLKSALGLSRTNALCEEMMKEINPEIVYSAYDVACNFMSIPDRVSGLGDGVMTELKKLCGKAPYVKYVGKKTIKEEEAPLILSA